MSLTRARWGGSDNGAAHGLVRQRSWAGIRMACGIACGLAIAGVGSTLNAQQIVPKYAEQLSITDIGSEFFGTGRSRSRVTQMLLTDGPQEGQQYLYMATERAGIRRAIYDHASNGLVAGSLEDIADGIDGVVLGIALHGNTLYATEMYTSNAIPDGQRAVDLSRIWRINDAGLGAQTPIVEGIPRQDHGTNQLQIIGDSLYVGIGVRTRNGVTDTWNGDTHGESAYGGTIAMIEDLNAVGDEANAAGFYPANPTETEYRQLIRGELPVAGMPLTTTDPGKLRIHSTGTRNPFGLAVDGNEQLWFTNNFHRADNDVYDRTNLRGALADGDAFSGDGLQNDIHDQMFPAEPLADYGYRNGNWQDGNTRDNTEAIDAGFFQPENRRASFTFDNYVDEAPNETDATNPNYNQEYESDNPSGLGPSSSANGFDFYAGNDFPLALHQDAFIARWQPGHSSGDAGDDAEFQDVVAVDMATANVERIATGFRNPLDVIDDGRGNLIVADHGSSVFVISATTPFDGVREFSWDSDEGGAWSDRLTWNADSLPADERLVPDAIGEARYAVTIDRAQNGAVMLDRDVTVETVQLAAALLSLGGNELTSDVEVMANGVLTGNGEVVGRVDNTAGVVRAAGWITVGDLAQSTAGTVSLRFQGDNTSDRIVVKGTASLSGDLQFRELPELAAGETATAIVVQAGNVEGDFERVLFGDNPAGDFGHVGDGMFATINATSEQYVVAAYQALPGDSNGDRVFNSNDLIRVFSVGEYEDDTVGNSDWTDGDWNGDNDFDSTDMIVAFQSGGYSAAAQSVPEPNSGLLLLSSLLFAVRRRR